MQINKGGALCQILKPRSIGLKEEKDVLRYLFFRRTFNDHGRRRIMLS